MPERVGHFGVGLGRDSGASSIGRAALVHLRAGENGDRTVALVGLRLDLLPLQFHVSQHVAPLQFPSVQDSGELKRPLVLTSLGTCKGPARTQPRRPRRLGLCHPSRWTCPAC